MVSTAMQGGCPCENACNLRIGTSNVELAALFAPRPLGMSSANDWTRETATKGYPELKQLYTLLQVPERVGLASLTQYPHNFNSPSREAMYEWFNRWLDLDVPERIVEEDYIPLSREEIRVWSDEHPSPPSGPTTTNRPSSPNVMSMRFSRLIASV